MADPSDSIETALDTLRESFRRDVAAGLRATCQVELSGEEKAVFWLRVDEGRLSLGEGRTPRPDVVFQLEAADFFAVLRGDANPDLLFLEDRIVIEGSLSLALELRVALTPPRTA